MLLQKLQNVQFLSLEAPVLRVAAPDTIFPFPQAEAVWLPNYKDIIETAKKVLTF